MDTRADLVQYDALVKHYAQKLRLHKEPADFRTRVYRPRVTRDTIPDVEYPIEHVDLDQEKRILETFIKAPLNGLG